MEDPDSDTPALSGLALQALEDFRAEQALQFDGFEQLDYSHDLAMSNDKALSMEMFPENWNASQFWVGRTPLVYGLFLTRQ
ncbi:hypothetical protein A1O1_00013 [Capronia coronata CBS 617.96]|uniref:Uncharacterized protein n=1 Tax=Capronia coronata CBS 617.96 TaxID=1182541 RepID=W9YZ03_9EURO|nr:uncharacterized protein A1O1_00013 [Capronia coronata CBS 617.96]EXJ94895.1 hypothetical protein A1O1_00013 [Capronia coronata CBS 617.96]